MSYFLFLVVTPSFYFWLLVTRVISSRYFWNSAVSNIQANIYSPSISHTQSLSQFPLFYSRELQRLLYIICLWQDHSVRRGLCRHIHSYSRHWGFFGKASWGNVGYYISSRLSEGRGKSKYQKWCCKVFKIYCCVVVKAFQLFRSVQTGPGYPKFF